MNDESRDIVAGGVSEEVVVIHLKSGVTKLLPLVGWVNFSNTNQVGIKLITFFNQSGKFMFTVNINEIEYVDSLPDKPNAAS